MTRIDPFSGSNYLEVINNNKNCEIDFPDIIWKKISIDAKDLCIKMLKKDPKERISSWEAQNHPWFKTSNTCEFNEIFYDDRELLLNYLLNYLE